MSIKNVNDGDYVSTDLLEIPCGCWDAKLLDFTDYIGRNLERKGYILGFDIEYVSDNKMSLISSEIACVEFDDIYKIQKIINCDIDMWVKSDLNWKVWFKLMQN